MDPTNLEEVCSKLLDNADLVLDLSGYPKITLTFAVIGDVDSKFWEVIFELSSTFDLSIIQESDIDCSSNDSYAVFEASVKKIDDNQEYYQVHVGDSGDFDLMAKSLVFNWSAIPYDEGQFKEKYGYLFSK